jgi:ParB family transcriptional regulator, chromosome partitioning protein
VAGLGKGFDALIPTDFDPSLLIDSKDRIQKLLITRITANPDQPRRHFDQQALNELAASINQFGVLQPLIVSPLPDNTYRIIAGERRWRASQIAGLTDVPAIIREPQEIEELEIALIENVQRVDLSPLEQAISIERLHQQFNMTYKQIAERLAKAETTVSNLVRLLQLPEDARDALAEGKISEGHARAILALKATPELQTELLEQIIKNTWSVRQAEQFVTTHKQGIVKDKTVKERMATETAETKQLSKKLHTPVSVRRTAKGGRLELHFKTDEDLQKLIELLSKI